MHKQFILAHGNYLPRIAEVVCKPLAYMRKLLRCYLRFIEFKCWHHPVLSLDGFYYLGDSCITLSALAGNPLQSHTFAISLDCSQPASSLFRGYNHIIFACQITKCSYKILGFVPIYVFTEIINLFGYKLCLF